MLAQELLAGCLHPVMGAAARLWEDLDEKSVSVFFVCSHFERTSRGYGLGQFAFRAGTGTADAAPNAGVAAPATTTAASGTDARLVGAANTAAAARPGPCGPSGSADFRH